MLVVDSTQEEWRMRSTRIGSLLLALVLALYVHGMADGEGADREAKRFFEEKVRPLLAKNCHRCHGEKKQEGGLRLDSLASVLAGNESGPAIVPGKPEKSNLVAAVRHDGEIRMPPKKKLPPGEIEVLVRWVEMGAPWPGSEKAGAEGASWKSHWAFQRLSDPPAPGVKHPKNARSPVDAFVLEELEKRGMSPSPRADRRTLIRRVAFDLTGLPPTPEEVRAFEEDPSADAYERLVDRLLASPRYGERWGRHWMDVARYADTKGYVFTAERRFPYAYTYRDYVVRSLNDDLPYDRFILEQLAADQLRSEKEPLPRKVGSITNERASLAAMGFLTLGRRFLNNTHDIINDRIDVVTRGLMALTVQCARCHDHKYDPIPMEDYYSLYGVFANSVEPKDLPLIADPDDSPEYRKFEEELARRRKTLEDFISKEHLELLLELRQRVGDYLLATLKDDEGGGAFASLSKGEIRPRAVERWRDYLRKSSAVHGSLFAPWEGYARLHQSRPEEFTTQSEALLKGWTAAQKSAGAPDGATNRVNALILEELRKDPPGSLEDVARLYERLMAETDKEWRELVESRRKAGLDAPRTLEDPPREEIRRFLQAQNSPVNIPREKAGPCFDRATRNRQRELQKSVDSFRTSSPTAPPRAMILVNREELVDAHVFLRGNHRRPGKRVPRRFLSALSHGERKPFAKDSGRLELARAIASEENPLTGRVLVNRVWMHHFGEGLVGTPSDFGLRSKPPTHLALLDYLTTRFLEKGWSLKTLHRLILLSSVYQQRSDRREEYERIDPENRLLWRASRRRLDFEAMRDALLRVAGRLDLAMGGPSVRLFKKPFTGRGGCLSK